jgi:hypothetical protein
MMWREVKVGISSWRVRKGLLRNCVTVSDEAFAILLLDNNMEKWREQVEEREDQENQNDGGTTVTTKYTASGRMWSRKGMSRFVEIYNVVSEGQAADKNRATAWDAKLRESSNVWTLFHWDAYWCHRGDLKQIWRVVRNNNISSRKPKKWSN